MRKSLSSKIGIVVALLITLSIFSFVFVYVIFEADRRTQELIEEKRNLNEILAFSIESAEYQSLTWYKKYMVKKVAEPEDVVYCRLVKPAGEIFLSSIEEERGLYIADPAVHTNQTIIKNDFFNGEKIIVVISPTYRGQTLWLGFSLSKVNAAVSGILIEATIMAVTATLICVPVSYFIVSRALNPIKKLTDICKHLSEGNLKVRADVQASDEIGMLSKTFNNTIAKLRETQEQLLKSERMAAIGETAAMVGHDLRNPLQAIVGSLYLAEKKLKSMPSQLAQKQGVKMLLHTIGEQVGYMNKIVSDLQDYTRPIKPELVPTGLRQLINDSLSAITIPENVKVSVVVEEDFSKVMVDPLMMKRVFINLVMNALQAMPDGGQLTIRAAKKKENALISVEDTGVGMPKENIEKLFQPLFTTKSKGQGFGLPVCKRLVEAHRGSITAETQVGKGSTLTFKIPLRKEVS